MKYQKRVHWDRRRPEFLKIGFIFALAITFMAFNYTSSPPIITPYNEAPLYEADFIIVPPPTVQKQKVLPPPPPPKISPIIDIEPIAESIMKFETPVEIKTDKKVILDEFADDPIPDLPPILMPIKEDEPENSTPQIYAERMPIYGNCDLDLEESARRECTNQNLIKHIYGNVKYPPLARENDIEGTVVVSFIVNNKGNIVDVNILRGIGSGCGEEVKRVIEKLGQFLPGKQNGRPVSVIYRLPVKFSLQ